MALGKKKVVKKKVLKKKAAAPATKKKVLKKKAAPAAKKKVLKVKGAKPRIAKGNMSAGKGKYAYEPYRAKKNVGNAAKNACLQGKDTNEVISIVMEEFADCNISAASVGYYRSALRKEGYDL